MSSWIDRALAIRTVDADDVPTDGKFRTWKFIGATLTPDGDRLIVEILGGSLLEGAGGTIDVSDTGISMTSAGLMTVALASVGMEIDGGPIVLAGGNVTLGGGFRFVQAAAPTSGSHLTNKTYVDGLVAAGVPDPLTIGTINITTELNLGDQPLVGVISIDGSGNDVQCNAASWIFAAATGFEAHGPDGWYADSSTGEVSIRAGGAAATGIGAGQMLLRAGTDLVARAKGVSIRASGAEAAPDAPGDGAVIIRGDTIELTGTLTNNGSPIGGSYTAGDGLSLTGSDFDVDLTDTTIFTAAGAASRVPVLDGSSMLVASGVASSGAVLLSADSSAVEILLQSTGVVIGVDAADSITEAVGSASRVATASSANRTETYAGTLTIATTGACTVNGERIDRVPIATSSSSTGTLAFGSGLNLLTSAATDRALPNITATDVGRIISVRLASGGSCDVVGDGSDTINGGATYTIDASSGRAVVSFVAVSTTEWETLP